MATLREYKVVQDIDLSENILKRVSEIQAGRGNTIVISADNKAGDITNRSKYSAYIDSQLFKIRKSKFEKDNTDEIVETFTDCITIQEAGIDLEAEKVVLNSPEIIIGNSSETSTLSLTSKTISTDGTDLVSIKAATAVNIYQPSKAEPFIKADASTVNISASNINAVEASFNTCNIESLKIDQKFTIRWDEDTKSIIFEIAE